MGKPAATLTFMHVCPKTTGTVPHVGGPIVIASPNVIIGGLPAARKGDKLICVGPPDAISAGSGSVLINGKPAARLGDATQHGGKIVIGNPTVLIGDRYQPDKQPPPQSFAEAEQRLAAARAPIDAARKNGAPLPGSPYSTADKREIVAHGLDEPLLCRVILDEHNKDSGYIGYKPPNDNTAKYWTTTFTQAEHGDTDPEALCKAVGIDYDPNTEYALLIIDHQAAAELGDLYSFIPDYQRIGAFTQSELASEFAGQEALIHECLTPEFSRYYEQVVVSANQDGITLEKNKEFIEYCESLGFSPDQTDALTVRHQIKQGLGANEHFLGNGVTKDISVAYEQTPFGPIDDEQQYGPCETFTWDKNPQTLGQLEKAGAIQRIKIGKGVDR